jgi:hypothetical protein
VRKTDRCNMKFGYQSAFVRRTRKVSCPATRHGGVWGGRRYSSYSFLTSALDWVSSQRHAPAAIYPRGKDTRYPLDRRLSGPQSLSGRKS